MLKVGQVQGVLSAVFISEGVSVGQLFLPYAILMGFQPELVCCHRLHMF